ncbi:hypothetical protein GA0115233_107128 [Streptomyces sp. DI166]|nr:hypothetical protein GA0115233_107128 [Streptomyces sp. DI166]
MAAAGLGREITRLGGDRERVTVGDGAVGDRRDARVTHPHLDAFDTVKDA